MSAADVARLQAEVELAGAQFKLRQAELAAAQQLNEEDPLAYTPSVIGAAPAAPKRKQADSKARIDNPGEEGPTAEGAAGQKARKTDTHGGLPCPPPPPPPVGPPLRPMQPPMAPTAREFAMAAEDRARELEVGALQEQLKEVAAEVGALQEQLKDKKGEMARVRDRLRELGAENYQQSYQSGKAIGGSIDYRGDWQSGWGQAGCANSGSWQQEHGSIGGRGRNTSYARR